MKIFGAILFVALFTDNVQSISDGHSGRRTFLDVWPIVADDSSTATMHPEPTTMAHLTTAGRHSYEVGRVHTQLDSISAWSANKKKRKDPYAPVEAGAATVNDWCNQEAVHDPACKANPVAMTLQEEIDAVMKHFLCMRRPKECEAEPDETSEAKHSHDKPEIEQDGKESEKSGTQKKPSPDVSSSDEDAKEEVPAQNGKTSADAQSAQSSDTEVSSATVTSVDAYSDMLKNKYGDSDKAFKAADKDRNGELSQPEFEGQCRDAGVGTEDCEDLQEGMAGGRSRPLSEQDYKDAVGATPREVSLRMRSKYQSSDDAFEAADADKDNSLSEWELYEQCSLVATVDACKELQRSLGAKGSISKEAYKKWMETGRVPDLRSPGPAAAPVAASPAPAVMGPSPAAGYAAAPYPAKEHVDPEESATKLTGLVDKLGNISQTLEEGGQLDPELKRALGDMIARGKKIAEAVDTAARLGVQGNDKELDSLFEDADAMDEALFKFQTEVHPHGYKWWRYRWEYAFVEANLLNLLICITTVIYAVINYVTSRMSKFRSSVDAEDGSMANLYHSIFTRAMHELNVLGAVALLIWALEECGLFLWIVKFLPATSNIIQIAQPLHNAGPATDQHWPTTDYHVIYTLRSVNMHLFLGMMLYYLLMYHIAIGATCILEQFMRHENPDFYGRFLEQGCASIDFASMSRELKVRAEGVHKILVNKGPLGQVLSRDSTMARVFGHFDIDEDFENFRNYVANHVKYHEGFEELHKLIPTAPMYPYLARKLRNSLESLICIDWHICLLIMVVLVGQSLVHYFLHIAQVELLPITIAFGCLILAFQFIWTRRRVAYVVDKESQASSREEGRTTKELEARESFEKWVLWLQQIVFFFLCFSAARLLFSSFFWSDYFRLSCCMLILFLSLYALIATICALTVPMFLIMLSVPPHVTKNDREEMMAILQTHSDAGFRPDKAKGDASASRCSTDMSVI
jgi:hypothetical protein